MIIDTHWHIVVPEILKAEGADEEWRPAVRWEGDGQLVEFRGRVIRSAVREFVQIERMLEEARRMGVDHLLLCPWVNLIPNALPTESARRVCAIQNESISRMALAYPERVSGLGILPYQEPETAARELSGLMRLPGIRGIEITASVQGVYLGDDRFLPIWEAAETCGAMVFIHPTTRGFDHPVFNDYYLWNTVGNPMETTITAAHMIMSGVMERFPRLKVLLAHGGGGLLALRGRLRHSSGFQPQAMARLKGSFDDSLRRFYFDTVTHDTRLLGDLVDYAGADHVVLGSDYPFDMGTGRAADEVRETGLPASEEDAVLGGTASRLLELQGVK